MSIRTTSGISMKKKSANMSFTIGLSGKTILLKPNNPVATDDTIDIHIPAGCFANSSNYRNAELNYNFFVRAKRTTLNYDTIMPKPGNVKTLPDSITIVFPTPVVLKENAKTVVVYRDDEADFAADVSLSESDSYRVFITHKGNITKEGVYRFEIPEGLFHKTFYGTETEEVNDRWNEAFDIEYTIGGQPDEPEPEPQPEDSETMKTAKQLLTVSGVGYPSEDAPSRTALKNLTEAEETPADDDIKAAIQAFYAETKVTLPTKDEWYQIVGVNSENDCIYVTLEDEGTRASVSKDKAKAAMFQAVAVDDEANTVVFATKDGKYLHVLSALPNYDMTLVSNLTDEQSDVNKLVFDKFTAQSLNNEEITDSIMFGKFTMKGQLGKNQRTGTDDEAYACLNYTNQGSISTEAHNDNELFLFDVNNSHAFIIKPASEPTEDLITPVVSLEKDSIGTDTETLKLFFYNVEKVLLKDVSKAYFKLQGKDGKVASTATTIITAIDNVDNEFLIHVNGLSKDSYELVMPVGTFDFSKNVTPVKDMELVVAFHFGTGGGITPGPNPDNPFPNGFIPYNYASWLQEVERGEAHIDYIADYELNDFILFSLKDTIYIPKTDGYEGNVVPIDTITGGHGIYADPTRQVRISYYYNIDEVIATGHFEPYNHMDEHGYEHYQGIKLVLDTPVAEGCLDGREGLYSYVVYSGTYGDSNFAKYLKDSTSISLSQCMANEHKAFTVHVDNEKAKQRIDKIDNLDRGIHQSVVFDLQGRRHTGALKPGLYIIDGKKRVVK